MLITTLVVSFLVCCRLEVRCGYAGVVSGLQLSDNEVAFVACPCLPLPGYRLYVEAWGWSDCLSKMPVILHFKLKQDGRSDQPSML